MDSRQSESVCATVPTLKFLSLSKEVRNNGVRSAVSNRMNSAADLREYGDIEAAQDAEKQAEIMQAIAKRNGF